MKRFLLSFAITLLIVKYTAAQTGYIYVHLKSINEENSTNFSFTLTNSSGVTVSSFSLNDQATADNVALSGNLLNVLDLGISHGTGGDGELWATTSTSASVSPLDQAFSTGTIYYRVAGTSNWIKTAITNAAYIDGAYANQCVYVDASHNVYFYNNGTTTQLYSGGDAWDVTANGGRVAISTGTTGIIRLYSNSYSAGSAPSTGGTWTTLTTAGSTARLDMNLAATSIVYQKINSNAVSTVLTASPYTVTALTTPGISSALNPDVAYDDDGVIYAIAHDNSTYQDIVYDYSSGTWTPETPTRQFTTVTAGAAHLAYGTDFQSQFATGDPAMPSQIFSRQVDGSGNIYWIDDERIKSSSSLSGNGIVIPVTAGTYTLTETLPSSSYDLGRYNIYDPGGKTTGNVNTQVVTYVVTAGEVVFAEYVNESLVPKAIALTCSFQYLQTFDATASSPVYTYTFGSGTYGTNLEGTAMHFWANPGAYDGYYSIVKNTSNWWTNTGLTDHTGNNGYFLLADASFAPDEFYRQRVTNLVPGLSYTISFYAANVSPAAPQYPNVYYGLQDTLGNIVSSQTTGNITSSSWVNYTFTFTATTSRADLFLRNINTGGNGNDIAIDDISINPIYPVLGANGITPSSTDLCVGSNYTFSNTTSGGIWTSSNTTIATINAKSGSAFARKAGSAVVTYSYTNSIGCTSTSTSQITVAAPPVVTATDKLGGSSCLGQTDSLYTNFTTTSTAPYTYAWSVSPSSGDALSSTNTQNSSSSPTAGGTYTFTTVVTDAVGCSASSSVTVNVSGYTAPTVSASASITNPCNTSGTGVIATLSGSVSGSLNPNYTYQWSGPGSIVPSSGTTSATSFPATATVSTGSGGQFTLTVTDANGCKNSATTTAKVQSSPVSVTAGTYTSALCTGSTPTVDSLYSAAAGGVSPYTYSWVRATGSSGTVTYSGGSTYDTTGVSISGATTGSTESFTVTAKDANGCTATATTSLTVKNVSGPSINTQSASTICLGSTIYFPASVIAGSSSAFTFNWTSNSGATGGLYHTTSTTTSKDTITPTAAGSYTYTLKAIDGNGCAASATTPAQTVNGLPTAVVTSQTSAFCGTSSTVQLYAIASGGGGSYTYAWASSVASGSGTTSLSSTSIYNPVASISGASTGSSFKYTATVTDNNGCTGTAATSVVPVTTSPSVSSVTATPASLCSGTTIALSASFSGGTASYNYTWTPPSNSTVTPSSGTTSASPVTASATTSAAQNYTYGFFVIDANNCSASGSSTVFALNASPAISLSANNYSVCANPASTINLYGTLTTSTTSPYTYAWSGSGVVNNTANDTTTAVPATSGTYSVTVTDANGCTGTGTSPTVSVDQAAPSISVSCNTNSVQLYESNGVSWYWTTTSAGRFYPDNTYSVTDDSSTSHLQGPFIKAMGNYSVQITDAYGCIGTGSTTVSQCNNLLALKLNFSAAKQGNQALLQWSTVNESNNKYFGIERSADGINWQQLREVEAQGNNVPEANYSYTDVLPMDGINYYRIKQIDDNGVYSYSSVKSLDFTGIWVVKIYPNPAQSFIMLEFNNDKDENAQVTIQNVQGSTVFTTQQQLIKGLNQITLNQIQRLAQGAYFITLSTPNNVFKGKFVKGGN